MEHVGSADPSLAVHCLYRAVIANFVALAQGDGMPPPWVTYSPLLPLALLLFSGLYLFALPYATRWRRRRRADGVPALE